MLFPCSASFWGKILVIWFFYILKFYVRYIFYGSGFVSPITDHGPDKLLNRECCCRNMETQIWLDFRSCYSIHCRSTLLWEERCSLFLLFWSAHMVGCGVLTHVCVCILLQQDCVGVYSLNMRVIHGSGSSSGICTVINQINNIDMTWIFEVILGAVFFLSDF